jgi:hypothetical protein
MLAVFRYGDKCISDELIIRWNTPNFCWKAITACDLGFAQATHCLLPASCCLFRLCSAMKMEATCPSETSDGFHQIKRRYITEDNTLQIRYFMYRL